MVVSHDFLIGFRDVDVNSKMKNSAILDVFQNIAGIHSIEIGKKFKGMDSTWILTGYKVNIIKRPEYGDLITAYTWGTEIRSITAVREFEIKDKDGNVLITGISNWVHMSNNKFAKVTDETIEAYGLEPEKTNYHELKLKMIPVPKEYLFEKNYKVDWNWIDVNHHMNNIYYLDLADMVMPEELKTVPCNSFEVSYKKEVKYNENLKCFYSKTTDGSNVVIVKNEDLSAVDTIIKLDYWEKNKKAGKDSELKKAITVLLEYFHLKKRGLKTSLFFSGADDQHPTIYNHTIFKHLQ